MNEDIDRIIKGYKPRSDKKRYRILYDLIELITIMKLKFFSKSFDRYEAEDKQEV